MSCPSVQAPFGIVWSIAIERKLLGLVTVSRYEMASDVEFGGKFHAGNELISCPTVQTPLNVIWSTAIGRELLGLVTACRHEIANYTRNLSS